MKISLARSHIEMKRSKIEMDLNNLKKIKKLGKQKLYCKYQEEI